MLLATSQGAMFRKSESSKARWMTWRAVSARPYMLDPTPGRAMVGWRTFDTRVESACCYSVFVFTNGRDPGHSRGEH